MLSADLIFTARRLAQLHERRPRQSDLRRSISTAYYGLFHGLAEIAADRLVGATSSARKSKAWSRVYRSLGHTEIKKACRNAGQTSSSPELLLFTSSFFDLQELRHQADYDPNIRFTNSFVIARVDEAEQALASLQRVARSEQLDFITLALGMTRS